MSYLTERRQEEKDRRRAEIIDAAEALYAETGWDAITMDQVARRARLSRALLYVYFKDKSDLHLALVERSLDALRDVFLEAQQGQPRRPAGGRGDRPRVPRVFARQAALLRRLRALPGAHGLHATRRTRTRRPAWCAGHRVHEVIVESLNRGVADGSIRNGPRRPVRHRACRSGRSATV